MVNGDSPSGTNHEVFIEQDLHRLFAVLRVDGREARERLPLQIQKWDDQRRRWYLEKVTDRLMQQLGVKKVKVARGYAN